MKEITGKLMKLLLAVLLLLSLPAFEERVSAEEKDIAVGTEYYMGDSINFGPDLVYFDNGNSYAVMANWYFSVEHAFFSEGNMWTVNLKQGEGYLSLFFRDDSFTGEEIIKGIRCSEGNGTNGNPYRFELLFGDASEDTGIHEVVINVNPPKAGDSTSLKPDLSVPEDVNYVLTSIKDDKWHEQAGDPWDQTKDKFEENDVVEVSFVLNPKEGYTFAETLTLTVNGDGYQYSSRSFTGNELNGTAGFCVAKDDSEPEITVYPLWVGGKQVTEDYLSNEDEGWSYDPSSSTLTLNNAKISKGYEFSSGSFTVIYTEEGSDITILLVGENIVKGNQLYSGIRSDGKLTITGEGKLTVEGVHTGIDAVELVIDKTEFHSSGGVDGLDVDLLIITESKVFADGTSQAGIFSQSDIMISDSEVTATGGKYGVFQLNGDVFSIDGSRVTLKAKRADGNAILADEKLELINDEVIEPENGSVGVFDAGLLTWMTVFEEDGETLAKEALIMPADLQYSVVSGGDETYTRGSGKDLEIVVKRNLNDKRCIDHFKSVDIDGDVLVKGSDYGVKAGSTVVTLNASRLNKLSKGDHLVTVTFDDGSVSTNLTIRIAPAPEPDPTPVTPYRIPVTGVE